MKRIHVHIAVDDLEASIGFYSAVLGSEPTVLKPDYAKWLLEDPRVNLAISQRSTGHGLRHLGIQVDSNRELEDLRAGLATLDPNLVDEANAQCCYTRSNKAWATDPSGIRWEAFYSFGVSAPGGCCGRETA